MQNCRSIIAAMVLLLCTTAGGQESPVERLARWRTEARGDQRILAILVSTDGVHPYPPSVVHAALFGPSQSMNHWLRTVSHDQAWATGTVVGWYNMPLLHDAGVNDRLANGAPIPLDGVWPLILNRAAQDVDLRQFRRFIVVNPRLTMGFIMQALDQGTAVYATTDGEVRLAGSIVSDLESLANQPMHEVMHTLGLSHANRAVSALGPLGPDTRPYEYGDPYDVMGVGLGHINAKSQELLGWLSLSPGGGGLEVTQSGIYHVKPLETSSGLRYLRIPLERDSSGNVALYYYVECRRPLGYDARWPATTVQVRVAPWFNTMILDMNPATREVDGLAPMQTYTDAVRGVSIINRGVSTSGADVEIVLTPPQRDDPPRVRFATPMTGAVVSGKQRAVELEIGDDRGIQRVDVGGGSLTRHDDPERPGNYKYLWDTTAHPDGVYTLTARATDTSYRTTETAVTVTIANNGRDVEPPRVRITEPRPGRVVAGPLVWFRSSVTDNSFANTFWRIRVRYWIRSMPGGAFRPIAYEYVHISGQTNLHWEVAWNSTTTPDGNYEVRASAQDEAGNVGWSDPMPLGVWNSAAPLPQAGPGTMLRGDANGDGRVDIADATAILNYLFQGSATIACFDAADADDNEFIEISDAVRILDWLYTGGPAPAYPFPFPDVDPTPGTRRCATR